MTPAEGCQLAVIKEMPNKQSDQTQVAYTSSHTTDKEYAN